MTELFNLQGKRAFVTGKTGLLAPIWKETLEAAGCEVMSYGLPDGDVLDRDHLSRIAVDYTPDIIVNNAAWDSPPTSGATFWADFEAMIAINLTGAKNVCESFLPGMIRDGGGVIVNIGSIMGYGAADYRNYDPPFEKPLAYNLSKWALRGLSKSIAVQYGRYGIRCVTPSFGPYNGGKLPEPFLVKFLHNVPLVKQSFPPTDVRQCVSKRSLQQTLLYAVCCEDLTGQDWRIDGGLGSWA